MNELLIGLGVVAIFLLAILGFGTVVIFLFGLDGKINKR